MKHFCLFFGFLLFAFIGNAQDISIHKNDMEAKNYKMASSHINTLYAIEKNEKKVIAKPNKSRAVLKRNFLGRLSINGIKVSAYEFENTLKSNITAFSKYQEGANTVKTAFGVHRISAIAFAIGVGLSILPKQKVDLGFGRIAKVDTTANNIGTLTTSFSIWGIIIGSIIRSFGTGKMKRAVNLFNASNDAQVSLNPIIYKKHLGLSLALNF